MHCAWSHTVFRVFRSFCRRIVRTTPRTLETTARARARGAPAARSVVSRARKRRVFPRHYERGDGPRGRKNPRENRARVSPCACAASRATRVEMSRREIERIRHSGVCRGAVLSRTLWNTPRKKLFYIKTINNKNRLNVSISTWGIRYKVFKYFSTFFVGENIGPLSRSQRSTGRDSLPTSHMSLPLA